MQECLSEINEILKKGEKGEPVQEFFTIPQNMKGVIIGQKGSHLNELTTRHKVKV